MRARFPHPPHPCVFSLQDIVAPSRSTAVTPRPLSLTTQVSDVGILAMEYYIPSRYVSQTALEAADGVSPGKYTVRACAARM